MSFRAAFEARLRPAARPASGRQRFAVLARTELLWSLAFGKRLCGMRRGRLLRLFISWPTLRPASRASKNGLELLASAQLARLEAERTSRLKDEFLATLSHELRTPLNAILGWARLLHSGQLDSNTAARAIESVERNAKIQTKLVEDLLDVSRIITGKWRLDPGPSIFVRFLESSLEAVRTTLEAKEITLEKDSDPHVGLVLGDPSRLQQILWNLLSNAVKFAPKRGHIWVRVARDGANAEISVKDDGKGISEEFLPYVFERFRQADGSLTRKYGGLGLGLAIARHLTELHGGTVEVDSAGENQGASLHCQAAVAQ